MSTEKIEWIDLNTYVAQRLSMSMAAEAPREIPGFADHALDLWDRALEDNLDVGGEG